MRRAMRSGRLRQEEGSYGFRGSRIEVEIVLRYFVIELVVVHTHPAGGIAMYFLLTPERRAS